MILPCNDQGSEYSLLSLWAISIGLSIHRSNLLALDKVRKSWSALSQGGFCSIRLLFMLDHVFKKKGKRKKRIAYFLSIVHIMHFLTIESQ
jgi:hypothetical protein